jgi:hypothetical protein
MLFPSPQPSQYSQYMYYVCESISVPVQCYLVSGDDGAGYFRHSGTYGTVSHLTHPDHQTPYLRRMKNMLLQMFKIHYYLGKQNNTAQVSMKLMLELPSLHVL